MYLEPQGKNSKLPQFNIHEFVKLVGWCTRKTNFAIYISNWIHISGRVFSPFNIIFFEKKKEIISSIATNCYQVSSNTQSRAIETITLLTWSNSLINRVHHSRFPQFCMFRRQIFPHNRDFQQLYHRP